MTEREAELPPLPEVPSGKLYTDRDGWVQYVKLFTAKEMHAYARAAIQGAQVSKDAERNADALWLAQAEVEKATRKFPTWPTDPLHAIAVLGEEFGELTKDVLQSVYEPHKSSPEKVRTEAIQTAAMALRFLMSLDRYVYAPSEQHSQDRAAMAPSGETS